jgi:hypothetical protein
MNQVVELTLLVSSAVEWVANGAECQSVSKANAVVDGSGEHADDGE